MAAKNSTVPKNVVPLRLVQKTLSHDVVDVVEMLELLLEHAKRGVITGFAIACDMRKPPHLTTVAGSCLTNPTFARGMVASLAREIDDMMLEEATHD